MGRPVLRRHRPQRDRHQHGRPGFQLRADPLLLEELDYCVPLGIRHSHFKAWSDADRGYALAWQRNKTETCSCGTRHDEWETDRDAYVADVTYCRGHDLLAMEAENLPKDDDGKTLPGFIPHLVPRELYEALHPDND